MTKPDQIARNWGRLGLLAAIVLTTCAWAPSSARAENYVQYDQYFSFRTDQEHQVYFPQFDPILGELEWVHVGLSGGLYCESGEWVAYNATSQKAFTEFQYTEFEIQINGDGYMGRYSAGSTVMAYYEPGLSHQNWGATSGRFQQAGSGYIDDNAVDSYIGEGSMGFSFSLTNLLIRTGAQRVSVSSTSAGDISSSLMITYGFTPFSTPLPEPSSLALVGVGGGLLFLRTIAGRRRGSRRSARPSQNI